MSWPTISHSPSFQEESGVLESVNISDNVEEEHDMQSVLAMKKNLFGSFEKASEQKVIHRTLSRPPLAPNNNMLHSNGHDSTGEQIRLSSLSSSTASSSSVRNPASKRNMLAVYLRIRPPACTMIADHPSDCTIEIVDHRRKNEQSDDESNSPREFPTSILTYPPISSQAYKSIRQYGDGTNSKVAVISGVKKFDFQRVFGPSDSQRNIYDAVAAPLVAEVFPTTGKSGEVIKKGQSALLFSYGITNAGKTYTIMGDDEGRKCGIIPRVMDGILKEIHRREQDATDSCQYQLNASFYEIYNEQVFDLLNVELENSKKSKFGGKDRKPLKIREDKSGYIFVQGLTKHNVASVAEGFQLALTAKNRRQTCSNNINGESSRSHSIYQLEMSFKEANNVEQSTSICIVDLAGSERASRTGNVLKSSQQREAAQINASLMNLMQCIQQLNNNQKRPSSAGAGVVPFRGSKLSHLFMNHLTGASAGKTAMILNVNPVSADFDETQHVLSYAVLAKNVKINAEEYHKKVSVIAFCKVSSNKASYESDNEGRAGKKRTADRSKENSATRKIAKRFSPRFMANKREVATKQAVSEKRVASAPSDIKSELSRQKFDHLLEKSSKLIETNQILVAEVDTYRKQASIVHEAELMNSSTLEHENRILLEEVDSMKGKLVALQGELVLLNDELTNKESEIRAEVGDDFDKQIAMIREQYEGMRRQQEQKEQDNNTSILVQSTRKIQRDKAEDFIDELMDKNEECEEELQRMRQSHKEELEKLVKSHKKSIKAKELEIADIYHLHKVVLAAKDAEIEKLIIDLNVLSNGEYEDQSMNVSSESEVKYAKDEEIDGSPQNENFSDINEAAVSNTSHFGESDGSAEDKSSCVSESCDQGESNDLNNSSRKSNTDDFGKLNDSENGESYISDIECEEANEMDMSHLSKENVPIEIIPNENSARAVKRLRQGRYSAVACQIVHQNSLSVERGPLSNISRPLNNACHGSESDDTEQEMTLGMRLRSRNAKN